MAVQPFAPHDAMNKALLSCLLALTMSSLSHAKGALLWNDEFNQKPGSRPQASHWTYDLGTNNGWGNKELQTYTDKAENACIVADPQATDGRALAIRAVKQADGSYCSARLKTEGLYTMTYGLLEARLKVPHGKGLLPAFWLLGANIKEVHWPHCGEIDVMEVLGHQTTRAYGTLHGQGFIAEKALGKPRDLPTGQSFDGEYHLFSVERSPKRIRWMIDGVVYHDLSPEKLPPGSAWVYDAPFFVLLNVAVGGVWPGYPDDSSTFPVEMRVDYVRVYALQDSTK
jgi:beta-glucanase (GH16 family)